MQQQMLTLAAFHTLDKQPRHTTFFVIVGLCLVQVCCYLEKKKKGTDTIFACPKHLTDPDCSVFFCSQIIIRFLRLLTLATAVVLSLLIRLHSPSFY